MRDAIVPSGTYRPTRVRSHPRLTRSRDGGNPMAKGRLGLPAVALVGVVFASTAVVAGPGDVVTACVGPNGQVRIVKPDVDCRPSEESTSWNRTGPSGADGAP